MLESRGSSQGKGPLSHSTLTREALDRLLDALDPDREQAALGYEQLRRRLQALFHFWGCQNGWELADRTLDRVAVKLEQGAVVPRGSMTAYVRGVARMLFYEATRELEQEERALAEVAPAAGPDPNPDHDRALQALDECLASLTPDDRRLILDYYGTQGRTKELRRQLASSVGSTINALRIRAHRLRQRLEGCVAKKLKRSGAI
jgi:DNA-directed RNA polymerase specialized sigma24 family protein